MITQRGFPSSDSMNERAATVAAEYLGRLYPGQHLVGVLDSQALVLLAVTVSAELRAARIRISLLESERASEPAIADLSVLVPSSEGGMHIP